MSKRKKNPEITAELDTIVTDTVEAVAEHVEAEANSEPAIDGSAIPSETVDKVRKQPVSHGYPVTLRELFPEAKVKTTPNFRYEITWTFTAEQMGEVSDQTTKAFIETAIAEKGLRLAWIQVNGNTIRALIVGAK